MHHAITGHLACCAWDQTQDKPRNCFDPAGVALMHSLAVGAVNTPSAVTAPMRFFAPAVDEHLRVALHRLREHRQRPRPVALNLLCLQLVHGGVLCRVSHFDGAAAEAGALPSSSSQRPVRQVASFKSALQSRCQTAMVLTPPRKTACQIVGANDCYPDAGGIHDSLPCVVRDGSTKPVCCLIAQHLRVRPPALFSIGVVGCYTVLSTAVRSAGGAAAADGSTC